MLLAPSPRKVTVRPASVALVLADGLQVGEQLAGVELVGQRVDHRDAGVRGHRLEPVLAEGPPDDGRDLPAQHPGGVLDGLAAADLARPPSTSIG